MRVITTILLLLMPGLSSAQELSMEHPLVHASVVATPSAETVLIQVFIVKPTDRPFIFYTGSAGGGRDAGPHGGAIKGPDHVLDREKEWKEVIGTPPDVLPTLYFLSNGKTNQWTAISVGCPTFRSMRPSVFTVEPMRTNLYCRFFVKPERIAGAFLKGEVSRATPRGRFAAVQIPITRFRLQEEEKNPNKAPEDTARKLADPHR
ncbi:MAG: hypothetical protein KBA51_04235 [Kiritimatiellae bacterium]|nr:hypothetical protein [Kiritimatiellia bacterium]